MAVYDAIVFDMDGVLVERTDTAVLRDGVAAAFDALDVSSPPQAHVEGLAEQEFDALADAAAALNLSPDELWETREEHVSRHQRAAVREGGKPLFDDVTVLSQLEADLALVSNNQHATVEFVVDHHGLDEHFEVAYGRDHTLDGAKRKKPEPHYIERALDDLGAREALYVGDSPKDVVAAHRADADSAFVRRPHRGPASVDREPTYRVSDLNELADELTDAADSVTD